MNDANANSQIAFVFPGQGSQSVGMVAALAETCPEVKRRFETASHALDVDLWTLANEGPEELLNQTENTQPALLAASVATWDIWISAGGAYPAKMAGHSFGEYSALVCAGALDFGQAVKLVADRGRFMQEAVPAGEGGMAALLGLALDEIEKICTEISEHGICAPANINATGQVVIAGNAQAIDAACALASERGAKRAIRLPVSVPAHCELMRPAAERLAERLTGIDIATPQIDVLHNFDVQSHADTAGITSALVNQMYSPVRWVEIIESFARSGVRLIIECGPGKVLSGLVKRIDRSLECVPLTDLDKIRETVGKLGEVDS